MSRGCRIRRQIVVTSFSEFKGETSKQLLHKFYLPSIICTKDTAGLLHALQIIPWFVFRQSAVTSFVDFEASTRHWMKPHPPHIFVQNTVFCICTVVGYLAHFAHLHTFEAETPQLWFDAGSNICCTCFSFQPPPPISICLLFQNQFSIGCALLWVRSGLIHVLQNNCAHLFILQNTTFMHVFQFLRKIFQ